MAKSNRSKAGRLRRLLHLLGLLILAIAAVSAWGAWRDYQDFVAAPLTLADHERVLEVRPGDSFAQVLGRMRRVGIGQGRDWQWRLLAFELDVVRRLQVGEYAVGHGITPTGLLRKLESGQVIQHRFTLVEGWNFRELRQALAASDAVEHTLADMDDAEVMAALGRPGLNPEGRFLPETYLFTRGTGDVDLLKRALLAMDQALAEAWAQRAADLPATTPEQALVLASLVEKETGVAAERAQIAGVFARRLQRRMRLQTDPSVIYGMGPAYRGRIGRAGLDADTPYNTYTRDGLPPTPIAMPGRAALRAAVEPAPGDALYFVSRGDGSHHFSATLAEHNRAVARYVHGRDNGGGQR